MSGGIFFMRSDFIDYSGQKINNWLVLEFIDTQYTSSRWKVQCCSCNKTIKIKRIADCKRTDECKKCQSKKEIERKKGVYNKVWQSYRTKAKKRNIKFELTREQFENLIEQPCHYCNQIINKLTHYEKEFIYSGVDRMDSNLGYNKENCVPCCKICNRSKSDMSYEKFIHHIQTIAKNYQQLI
jgi:hypothetical protein